MASVAVPTPLAARLERRRRTGLARRLETLVAEAEHPTLRPGVVTARVPLDGAEVRRARPVLLELAALLRSPAPVGPAGLRRVRLLLTDGTGPVYVRRDDGDLVDAAEAALGELRAD